MPAIPSEEARRRVESRDLRDNMTCRDMILCLRVLECNREQFVRRPSTNSQRPRQNKQVRSWVLRGRCHCGLSLAVQSEPRSRPKKPSSPKSRLVGTKCSARRPKRGPRPPRRSHPAPDPKIQRGDARDPNPRPRSPNTVPVGPAPAAGCARGSNPCPRHRVDAFCDLVACVLGPPWIYT